MLPNSNIWYFSLPTGAPMIMWRSSKRGLVVLYLSQVIALVSQWAKPKLGFTCVDTVD